MIRHPIFVVGLPRSGTTLLSTILDAHPEIAISPETHFYTRCRPGSGGYVEDPADVLDCLLAQPGVRDMDLDGEEVDRLRRLTRCREEPEPAGLLHALLEVYAERRGTSAWGEKTPNHLWHLDAISADFPEGVIVAIVRDPRDVWLSVRDMPWSRDSLPEHALAWRRAARVTERYRREHGSRFLEVRYEDLLEEPETEVRKICSFLEARYRPEMLVLDEASDAPVDPDREPWKEKAARPIDPTNKEKWRTEMSPADRFLIQRITGSALAAKGYSACPVEWDWSLLRAVGRTTLRAGATVLTRKIRGWSGSSRGSDEYTPEWMRE